MERCKGLVTGASMGVGFAASKAIASMGCDLAVNARGAERLSEAARLLAGEYGVNVTPIPGDLRVKRDVLNVVSEALRRLGHIDYAVLSYGNPSREPVRLHESEWEDWVEAASLYIASTATIFKVLIERNSSKATVIVVSSFTVAEPMPPLIIADTLRAGLSRLVRIAAREYPEKLRPILLLLGSFDTPGARRTIERMAKQRGEDPGELWRREVEGISPLKRAGTMEELANIIKLLLKSPEYLTGATILFDGATSRIAWP
ncbi:MAG: SDR family oxidoreductase [Thermoprotei archaeon]|nr:SDR family oxidoreductase [Thermoprotei archaeon]